MLVALILTFLTAMVFQVKEYERLSGRAVLQSSANFAIDGLAKNPLVPSHNVAEQLAASYLKQHSPHLDYLK